MADRRVNKKLALDIIVVTSTDDLLALKRALTKKGVKEDTVLGVTYAGTPLKGGKVYSLGGVLTPTGESLNFGALKDLPKASTESFGSYPIAMDDLSDPAVVQAWWYLVNGQYGALREISRATRKRGSVGEQCQTLLTRATEHLQARIDAISLPISDIADYEAAEELLADLDATGMRDFRDQEKALKKALKAAWKDEVLEAELKARVGYTNCLAMLSSSRPKERADAVQGLRQLADLLPDTVYGKMAGDRASVYKGM